MTEAQWLLEGRAAPSGLKRPLWPQGHLVSGGRVHWGWDLVSKASRSETPLWETSSEGVEGPAMIETGPQDWRGWESPCQGPLHLQTCRLPVLAEALPTVPSVETRNFCI